jgi:hypothetical protein
MMTNPAPAEPPGGGPRLWLFNLDAALELESPGPYQTSKRLSTTLEPILAQAQALMRPGDEMLDRQPAPPARWAGFWGCAWSPTTSALRRLANAGARLAPTPGMDVLRRVNHRRFYLELGGGAPGARYVANAAELEATLQDGRFRPGMFKRPFGFAGRGQRRIQERPSEDDRRWLDASVRRGGLLVEPWLELTREVGLHGSIDAAGQVRFGQICVQEINAFRCWVASRRANSHDIDPSHATALRKRAEAVAEALVAAGYYGPFGIDAYLWRAPSGAIELNPLGELNARYTMGYAVGMSEPQAAP